MKTCNFGEHFMIDGYGGSYECLDNRDILLTALTELPEKLEMKKLCKPHVYKAKDNKIKDPGGWSGFVVIAESHISIHTFPARKFVSIDVYTCTSDLDRDYIKKYFKKVYKLKDIEENFVMRGTKYPADNIL